VSAGIGVQRGAKAWQIQPRLRLYSDLAIVIQDDQEKFYLEKNTFFVGGIIPGNNSLNNHTVHRPKCC
jgi:hypothetical protein